MDDIKQTNIKHTTTTNFNSLMFVSFMSVKLKTCIYLQLCYNLSNNILFNKRIKIHDKNILHAIFIKT